MDSYGRRRRRAVDGEQLLALGAAAVAEAGREARAKAGRARMRRLILIYLTISIRFAERRRADQRAELAKACARTDAPTRGFQSCDFFSCSESSVLQAARRVSASAPRTVLHSSRPDEPPPVDILQN